MNHRASVAQTKYAIPTIPHATLPRPGLVQRLDEGRDAALTLVVGLPGSGKTALLCEWARQLDDPLVWLQADPLDADPRRFWTALILGIKRSWPGVGLDALARLEEDDGASVEMATLLVNDLTGIESATSIVIDDLHLADPQAPVFAWFVGNLPTSVRLVLSARSDPALPLHRMRLQGRLLELRQDDLRLTAAEARRLCETLGVHVDDEVLERLHGLTEGWAAGVYLAGLALRNSTDPTAFVQGFAGSDRSVTDFLLSEILDRQPPEIEEFLLGTSALDSFDSSLCDEVLGRSDSSEMLGRLEDNNLFLVGLDRDGRWYRYHHLFAEFLRARLRATRKGRDREIQLAAARWYQDHDDLARAVRHANLAGDVEAAVGLLELIASTRYTLEDVGSCAEAARAWLREFGPSHLAIDPLRLITCVFVLLATGAHDDVSIWLRRIEHDFPSPRPAELEAYLKGAWGFLAFQRGRPELAIELAEEAEHLLGPSAAQASWLANAPVIRARAGLLLDRPELARLALDQVRTGPPRPASIEQIMVPAAQALTALVEGELGEAEQLAAEALDAADHLGSTVNHAGRIDALLARGSVLLERNRLDAAESVLEAALTLAERCPRPQMALLAQLQLIRVAHAREVPTEIADRLALARRTLPWGTPDLTGLIDELEARVAIDRGDVSLAAALLDQLPDTRRRSLLLARIHLARSRPGDALALLATSAAGATTRRQRIEQSLLSARAWAARDREAAAAQLTSGLRLAKPMAFVRIFLDEGPEFQRLLEALPTDAALASYVELLLKEAGTKLPPAIVFRVRQPLIEPLTDRELTVLRYLCSRLSNQEIASAMYVSLNTLKSHIKSIYRKLDATTRAEAAAGARNLGLL